MNNFRKKLPGTPYFFWSVLFIIIPLCMVFYYGLTDKSGAFTLENIIAVTTREHSKALWLSLLLSLIATVICLLLSYPLAMILCSRKSGQHSVIVFILILPMWMNFLLRTLAWQTLLEKTGVIVVPGSAFGRHGEGYVRMALVVPPERMQEAVRRIAESGILNR